MAKAETIVIEEMKRGRIKPWVIGESPLILHAMSQKTKMSLLIPSGRKTAAEKAQSLKHDPLEEYRGSAIVAMSNKNPTRLLFPATAFKSAICNAALEVPGAKKSQIGRLTWVNGDTVNLYGVPEMLMSITRSADMNRTPDVRTRPILRQWAAQIDITYVMPTLNEITILRLLEIAGMLMGVGDFRQEKGKGNYGQFRLATEDEVAPIIKAGGWKEQVKAMENPGCYDSETEALYKLYLDERKRRGK